MRASIGTTLRFSSLALLAASLPATAWAQNTVSGRAASLTVGGRLHAQYQASTIGAADNDFFLRRARLIADVRFNDFISGRVQTDFAGGGASLQDAFVRLDFNEDFTLYAGQFKRAFDIFELASSTDLSLIERDGRVAGYSACTGVGSVCSYSRLTEALDFAGRDVGVRVDGSFGALGYMASLTNGDGNNNRDDNDAKSASGRVSYIATDDVTVSGNVAVHDYLDGGGDSDYAWAWGGDVQIGTWRDGFLLQAALAGGDNWQSLDASADPGRFVAFQVVASTYVPLDWERISGVEPLGRVSIADPDGDVADDGGTLITPGVMFYLLDKNKFGLNVDYYVPQTGDSEVSFKVQMFLYF